MSDAETSASNKGIQRFEELASEWQGDQFKQKIQAEVVKNEVLKRVMECTTLLREGTDVFSETENGLEWDKLYEACATIMDNYTKDVDSILKKLEELTKKQYLWQESAFVLDSHRAAVLFNNNKQWMDTKENNLQFKRQELDKSAEVIRTTVERLTK